VNQKPTDNAPGVVTKLPPTPPAEFEVADIKPSAPGATQAGGGFQPGGRIDLHGIALKNLISLAWNLSPFEEIAGAPKWLDSANFDLVAKTSTTTNGPSNAPPIAIDDLRNMMKALLIERFKIQTHYEDRPVETYTLVAVKPKMKKADPANRTGCKTAPAFGDTFPPPMQATCQNITMAQFAEKLTDIAALYLHYPVSDSTNLAGAWDFTLTFTPLPPGFKGGPGGRGGDGVVTPQIRPGNAAPSSDGLSASDPSGSLSLFEAMTRQLGLKLESQKRPMPVLVIDHVERTPTEN
jgi:uncharacterized protein (TIGR03435 family)